MSASDKSKLDGIATGANKITVDSALSSTSTNPVQNKVVNTALSDKQATITGAATTITSSNLTASRALVSDTNGKVAVSAVTSTELGYLDGVTSAIQTQLNAKAGTAVATTSANGLMSSTDKTRVDDLYKRVAGYAVTEGTVMDGMVTAYKANITGVTLTHGTMIALKFHATNASGPYLVINSTGGTKKIYYKGERLEMHKIPAGAVILLVYDTIQDTAGAWHCIYGFESTYSNAALGQGYTTCSTNAATIAKTAALSSYALVTGGIVAVKFTYNVPANATLNINSKGAKPIYYHNTAITAGVINAGNTATFIYNGSQYHLIAIDSSSSSGDFLEIDITNVDQGTAIGINADTLGGVIASDYVLHDELNTEVNNVITELNTLKTDISDNYVLKNDIDKLSNSAQIDLEGVENTGNTVLANADLLTGMTYRQIMDNVYPIGRVIITFESEDPNVLYSWQTWERTANGRFLLGASDSYAVGSEGGEAAHTLTVDEMPNHYHDLSGHVYSWGSSTGNVNIANAIAQSGPTSDNRLFTYQGEWNHTWSTGGSQPHNNMPPYLAINIWKRTA